MKNNKTKLITITFSVFLIVGIILYNSGHNEEVESVSTESLVSSPFSDVEKKPVKKRVIPSAVSKRTSKHEKKSEPRAIANSRVLNRSAGPINNEILLDFSRVKIMSGQIELLQGVFGSLKKVPGRKLVKMHNGYFLYESIDDDPLENVFFDNKNKKYGVWTSEIKVVVPDDILSYILDSYDLELIYKSDVEENLQFLKAGTNFKIERDLEELRDHKGVSGVRIDLKYSKMVAQ